MLEHRISQPKKRIPWTKIEDELLKSFATTHLSLKRCWRKISDLLINMGYQRKPKDCKERFQNYLSVNFNKNKLTQLEIDKLFELIEIYGNKWTLIAQKLNNRTDQDVKNQFYALIKKVYRRLLKASLSKEQNKKCSKIVASLKPILISNIFCTISTNHQYLNIQTNMKQLFKNLIKDNRYIKIGDKLDENDKNKVIQFMDYFEELNKIYLQNKNHEKCLDQIISEKKLSYDLNQQKVIIQRILNNKPIFILEQQNHLIKVDINQQKDIMDEYYLNQSKFEMSSLKLSELCHNCLEQQDQQQSFQHQGIFSQHHLYPSHSQIIFNSQQFQQYNQEYNSREPFQDTENLESNQYS